MTVVDLDKMRKPTDAMVEAGLMRLNEAHHQLVAPMLMVISIYTAMIDVMIDAKRGSEGERK